ncbi:hypothetical protein BTS2_2450 [Bacillus sp. TS-2]|nr:hypothetical protein BTS2_2450 [Bacillus sp. TS-2]
MKYWLMFVVTLLLISGCSNADDSVEDDPNNQEPEAEEPEPEPEVPLIHPLTGLETDEINENRVISAIINNSPAARPQSGLLEADIVYEILAEYEVTRFVALYQSELPERIGPIRSARPYFVELADGYDSLLVVHGWSPDAEVMLTNGDIDYLNGLFYDGTLFQRSSDRKAPHNSYLPVENLYKGIEDINVELNKHVEPLNFLADIEETSIEGEEALDITVNYLGLHDVFYRYDELSRKYHRFNDEQTVDYETGEAIELDNIFIVAADHRVLDDSGRREVNLTSGGDAVLIHSGVAQKVEWRNEQGRILPYKDGEILPFKKGQTWINIIPSTPGIEESVNY